MSARLNEVEKMITTGGIMEKKCFIKIEQCYLNDNGINVSAGGNTQRE